MKKLSRTQAREEIEEFFKNIKSKTPKEIKKIKRLSMKYNLPLKERRKLFCGKCFEPYDNSKIRVKNNKKIVTCSECGHVSRWKL
jgi:RNase P subunit RPR2